LDDGSAEVTFTALHGRIGSGLNIGAELEDTLPLIANVGISSPGVKLHGAGFIVTPEQANALGLKTVPGLKNHIRPYLNGRDLTDKPRGVMTIDLFGLPLEPVRARFPAVYQHVLTTVKPERDQNNRSSYRDTWWVHGEPRRDLRKALDGLTRYIATVETAKYRFFQFLETSVLPDNMLIAIASDDAFHLGVLSSRIHVVYALAAGGTLEDRPRYNKTRCFDPFPFPACTESQKSRIRALAEELDAHRKRAQATHGLGLTDIYNVLEKVRAGLALTTKDKALHDAALVSTLEQLHDDLDAAVADAYGWTWPLIDAEILEKVVALNTARAAEEAKGQIRWLRPEYQMSAVSGQKSAQQQTQLGLTEAPPAPGSKLPARSSKLPAPSSKLKTAKQPWPKTLAERAKAVETALAAAARPITAAELTKQFSRAKEPEVLEILDTLVALARAHAGDDEGTFVR
jgi:hypothetical protein